ncbi:PLP-dependent cysteine synthase family protein [Haloparvum sedimenti]|uniref:PLP-dependent cysteine synthase family protein n=1 Tax=Haloparvum sedimenti TaxID=1678448 RepID=UPI00071E9BFD|nr:pyridoxal-phosphate dependent enzyme [Haloparvum sedimenti]
MSEDAPAAAPVDESTLFETPLVELDLGVAPTVLAKAEWFNLADAAFGGGSVKSRIAAAMLDRAEDRGVLDRDAGPDANPTVLEPSSGNTGAALARVGGVRGYDVEIVTKADAGAGKRRAIREAGAEIRSVPADTTYDAIIDRVEELVASGDYHWPNQYDNPANPAVHERTTGAEIRRQTDGAVTAFVTGVGTGGTVSGVARALDDDATVVGYEPAADTTDIEGLRYLRTGDHPYRAAYETERLDNVRYLRTDEAHKAARWLRERYADRDVTIRDPGRHDPEAVREHLRVDSDTAAHERGAFAVGPSSGGNVALVRELAAEGVLDGDDTVVTMLCDRGDRYAHGLWSGL